MDMVDESFIVPGTALGQELKSLMMARLANLGYVPNIQSQSADCYNLVSSVARTRGVADDGRDDARTTVRRYQTPDLR